MVRFHIKTATHHIAWERMLDIWLAADEIPLFETGWNFDHFYPIRGNTDGPCLEAWVTLSAIAQATTRLRLGTMVNGMHYRHPALVASMASSLDIVSNGRLELGLGAGWYALESDAYGIELGTVGSRMTRFEEGVEVIDLLLRQEYTDFQGEFFTLTHARNEPKPIQSPRPPFAIGGRGEKRTLRVAAQFGSMWDTTFESDPDDWLRLRDVLWQHCADVGRDPLEIATSSHLGIGVDVDPVQIAQRAARMAEAGVDVVVLYFMETHDGDTVAEIAAAVSDLA